jgi:hypothetical protein
VAAVLQRPDTTLALPKTRSLASSFAVAALILGAAPPALAAPVTALGATYAANVPATAAAGTTISVPVTVQNTGDEPWNVAPPGPVLLTYHWLSAEGATLVWEGMRTSLGADVASGASRTITASVQMPAHAGTFQLRFHLVKEGIVWFPQMSTGYRIEAQSPYAVRFGSVPIFTFIAGATHSVDVPLTNIGTSPWNATGNTPVRLSYHWRDGAGRLLVWDGVRTSLPADVPIGGTTTLAARIVAPDVGGSVHLTIDLVREGVAWFQLLGGTPVGFFTTVEGTRWSGRYDAPASASARVGETKTLSITIANTGNIAWNATGANPVMVSYHLFDTQGRLVVWDGARTPLGSDLAPGQSRTLLLTYIAPAVGSYSLNSEAVREGVSWFSGYGVPAAATALTVGP